MVLTQRQRLLATARGEHLDKLPFGARIDVWYNYHSAHDTLPEKYRGWSQTDIIRDLGAAAQYRFFSVVREEYRDMEVVEKHNPPYITTEYRTPLGTASKLDMLSTAEGPWVKYEVEKLFKSEKDYPIVKYILEHTIPVDNFGAYQKVRDEVGEAGMVMTGTGLWSAPQRIMREIMGYEPFFYELADHPTKVEELMEAMKDLERRKLKIAVNCDLEIFNICANWSDDIHTPVFRKYFIPWFQEVCDFLHSHGKLAMAHIDGEMKRLNQFFQDTHIDVGEAVTPAPQTLLTMKDFRQQLGNKVTIWGGIPSILFEPMYSDRQFDDYVKHLFRDVAPGYRFIVGMGDNLPFDGSLDRVRRVAELIDQYGTLPIEV
ncbi:MAG: uroporphyrinogen decarboxylase family protein [Dehalococcoidales bacterium]|nr:uroporphyrinogen decarboxylase family protein [Dehalococcoidales bacterium]